MIRRIIKINRNKCNGCGICADACHEGAIAVIDGKAQLTREDYCDGLGDCLPSCPKDAISFEEREAPAFDKEAVAKHLARRPIPATGSYIVSEDAACPQKHDTPSQLLQWPVQIHLSPIQAPCFTNSDLLIAADCTAYAYGSFHQDFMKGRITLIGCPKLDDDDYSEKLSSILASNSVKSITIVRMEVPCCRGIEQAVTQALIKSGKDLPCSLYIITTDGAIRTPESSEQ